MTESAGDQCTDVSAGTESPATPLPGAPGNRLAGGPRDVSRTIGCWAGRGFLTCAEAAAGNATTRNVASHTSRRLTRDLRPRTPQRTFGPTPAACGRR